ncbi:MAG: thiamine pyrophosphate-binding protein [Clostridiales bacterium]|nr:thiamine pyrophosphate-binding protein [Clostridiales bacterium]MCF8023498.1 thiamine pyrophosphate-binding protein [Clostridiales bacterium]
MNYTVAQVIIRALFYWGIKNIYGVSGDAVLPFLDALGAQDRIKYYSTVSEQGAAFMACGEARVTGGPGVCLSTEGPGALNLVNGVADANRDGIPLLVITGQVETGKINTKAKQYFNQQQLFNSITDLSILLTRPESVVETLKIAVEKALNDNTACHISVPKDIFSSPVYEYQLAPLSYTGPAPVSGNVGKVVNLLVNSVKPLIIAGTAAVPVKDEVYRLVELTGAAVIPAQGARGIYPGMEDFNVGGLGEAHIPPILNQADCIILVGSSPYEHKFINEANIIQIDDCPQSLAHQLRPSSINGDISWILKLINEAVKDYDRDMNWQHEIKIHHQEFVKMVQREAELNDKPISPRKVVAILNDIIPEDAVISIDSGEFMHWFDRGFIAKNQQVIISDYWRCMGSGLPFGLGARVAQPDKKVFILTGEGGFIMMMQEILTAAHYALPVVIVVFNNSEYLLEKHRMEKEGMISFGVDAYLPDIATFAEACGVQGVSVEDPELLEETLKKAAASDNTVIVNIKVNKERPLYI